MLHRQGHALAATPAWQLLRTTRHPPHPTHACHAPLSPALQPSTLATCSRAWQAPVLSSAAGAGAADQLSIRTLSPVVHLNPPIHCCTAAPPLSLGPSSARTAWGCSAHAWHPHKASHGAPRPRAFMRCFAACPYPSWFICPCLPDHTWGSPRPAPLLWPLPCQLNVGALRPGLRPHMHCSCPVEQLPLSCVTKPEPPALRRRSSAAGAGQSGSTAEIAAGAFPAVRQSRPPSCVPCRHKAHWPLQPHPDAPVGCRDGFGWLGDAGALAGGGHPSHQRPCQSPAAAEAIAGLDPMQAPTSAPIARPSPHSSLSSLPYCPPKHPHSPPPWLPSSAWWLLACCWSPPAPPSPATPSAPRSSPVIASRCGAPCKPRPPAAGHPP